MAGIVFLLCAATSLVCVIMLLRGYARTGVRLLLWSALCFAGLTIDNVLLYYDAIIVPHIDLSVIRKLPGLAALSLLLFGLIWDSH